VDIFNISIAEPYGLRKPEELLSEGLVFLGKEDYLGECYVFAMEKDIQHGYVEHCYFDAASHLLKKKEEFIDAGVTGENHKYAQGLHEYSIQEIGDNKDPAMFSVPSGEGVAQKELELPYEGELSINTQDGINGDMRASFHLCGDDKQGSIGGGLN
jgi:hypothetical protein